MLRDAFARPRLESVAACNRAKNEWNARFEAHSCFLCIKHAIEPCLLSVEPTMGKIEVDLGTAVRGDWAGMRTPAYA